MNFADVLHNEGMFLHNLGRYNEAAERLNAALTIKLHFQDAASTLRTSNILVNSLMMLERRADQYSVIDFATHGLVAGEVKGLSEPALVLTLPAHPTADDDGLLTSSRVARLTLDADWAVQHGRGRQAWRRRPVRPRAGVFLCRRAGAACAGRCWR